MKVTKIVREHIEDQINKLYQPTLDKIKEEMDSLSKKAGEAKNKVQSKAEKVLIDFLKAEGLVQYDKYSDSLFSLYLHVGPKAVVDKINDLNLKKEQLIAKRDNTVMDILVELELGGTKETLDKLLEKAIKDFSKNK